MKRIKFDMEAIPITSNINDIHNRFIFKDIIFDTDITEETEEFFSYMKSDLNKLFFKEDGQVVVINMKQFITLNISNIREEK